MLYFIDGQRSGGAALYEKHGLNSLLDSANCREYLAGGPGGKSGLIIASGGDTPRYEPDKQAWVSRFGREGSYVGIWNDNPPGPKQLARKEQLPGVEIELLDGGKWLVPMLRQWREGDDRIEYSCKLPTILERSQVTGRLVEGKVVNPLRSLWDRSCELADDLLSQMKDGAMRIDTDALDTFVGDLLAANYHVSLDEIGILGLLDVDRYRAVVHASLDWHRMRDLVGNLQRRLATAGMFQSATSSDSGSGVTQQIEADSMNTDQL